MIESPVPETYRDVTPQPLAKVAPSPGRRYGALAGLVAGAVAVTTGMLAAGIIDVVSPIDAVGSEFIDRVPPWLKELAIDWFGTNDKLALRIGIVVTLAIAALIVGLLAVRRLAAGVVGIGAFGLVGALAALHRPGESAAAALPPLVGAAIGIPLLIRLVRPTTDRPLETPGPSRVPLGWDRRRFLVSTGSSAAAAVIAGGIAEVIERRRVESIRNAIPDALPPVRPNRIGGTSIEVPADATVSPITPFITPNDQFYRIDTALSFPRISLSRFTVTIGGMVDTPLALTYDDLLARPQVERIVTLACVSNEVGGDLIGNASFQGVLLAELLNEAGVQAGAEQIFSTSLDGWTCGFPVDAALDGRDAMIAVGMNGEPLPLEHGFPARLVVPGLYGYVSATKWLKSIKLTTWDAAEGFWVPRGWARDAPIKTQSRIDVPRNGDGVAAGPTKIAGIAWAQHRGVERVEVRIDEGPWLEARLGADVTDDAWRQWVLDWDAMPGKYTIQVRATDKDGDTQTADVAPPDPDGATGYHTRSVEVA
ncbi:MAG: molybdopterin-dependent oxidoreductase [Actinomycetota bacterium]|nr:molybdopterin-dependent oxidoreductase [Actinomycetota bacterium]